MKHRKTLQELTIKDNFMFGAVMCDEKQCRHFLELALGFPIAQVTVNKEKSIVYHPQYKGIRLDVYAEDTSRTHYNVEMQAVKKRLCRGEPDIITVRLIWSRCLAVWNIRSYPIPMLYLSAILILLTVGNIVIRFAIIAQS